MDFLEIDAFVPGRLTVDNRQHLLRAHAHGRNQPAADRNCSNHAAAGSSPTAAAMMLW